MEEKVKINLQNIELNDSGKNKRINNSKKKFGIINSENIENKVIMQNTSQKKIKRTRNKKPKEFSPLKEKEEKTKKEMNELELKEKEFLFEEVNHDDFDGLFSILDNKLSLLQKKFINIEKKIQQNRLLLFLENQPGNGTSTKASGLGDKTDMKQAMEIDNNLSSIFNDLKREFSSMNREIQKIRKKPDEESTDWTI